MMAAVISCGVCLVARPRATLHRPSRGPQLLLLSRAQCKSGKSHRGLPPVQALLGWGMRAQSKSPQAELEEFESMLQESQLPVLVDFATAWCGPCKLLAKVLDVAGPVLSQSVKVVKIDTEKQEAVAGKYGIYALPTLILFRGGEVVDRREGFMSEVDLRLWLHQKLN